MPITRKDTVLKLFYEANGQQTMFGYDNLQFKTVNHPRKHKLVNLCNEFKIKQPANAIVDKFPFTKTSSAVLIGVVASRNAEHLAHFKITL